MHYSCDEKMPAFFFKMNCVHLDIVLSALQCNKISKFHIAFMAKQSYEYHIVTLYDIEHVDTIKSFLNQYCDGWENVIDIIRGEVAKDDHIEARSCPSPVNIPYEIDDNMANEQCHEHNKRIREENEEELNILAALDEEYESNDLLPLPKRMRA